MNFIFYPHIEFQEWDGGITVQFLLAKKLHEYGFNVGIFSNHSPVENKIFNNYVDISFVNDETVAIYCEAIRGNPLGCKRHIRWMLSELGQNVESYLETWNENQLIYFFGSETRFENKPFLKGSVYKILNILNINPIFKNLFSQRDGWCFTIRKASCFHDNIINIHPENSQELTHRLSHEELANVFNEKEFFVSYDPLTFNNNLAALCGCISIVYPIKNCNRENWLKKTSYWDFLVENNLGTNLYGIAYGIEEIEYARNTSHLVKQQHDEIVDFFQNRALTTLVNDVNNFDKCENTVKNVYLEKVTPLKLTSSIKECKIGIRSQFSDVTNLIKSNIKLSFFNVCSLTNSHHFKKLSIIEENGTNHEFLSTEIVVPGFFNQTNDEFLCLELLSGITLYNVLSLKEQFWKYGLESQLNYYSKYLHKKQVHFLMNSCEKIIGYSTVRIYKEYLILDGFIIDQNYRNLGNGRKLLNHIMEFFSNPKIILLTEFKNITFYEKMGFEINEYIEFNDKEINESLFCMSYGLNVLDQKEIEYYGENICDIFFGKYFFIDFLSIEGIKYGENLVEIDKFKKIIEIENSSNRNIFHLLLKNGKIIQINKGNFIINTTKCSLDGVYTFSSLQIDGKIIMDIILKYGEREILNFIHFYLHPIEYSMIYENNELISFSILRFSPNYIIVENPLKEVIISIIEKYSYIPIFLTIEKMQLSYFKTLNFTECNNIFSDRIIDKNECLMLMGDKPSYIISFYNRGLISNGILGGITMVSNDHLRFLYDYIYFNKCKKMAEFGVAKGGVLAISKMTNPELTIYGFDSWDGMPNLTNEDDQNHKKYEGVKWSSIEDVYESFNLLNASTENVFLIKGYIENTIDDHLEELNELDILRLDFDWYSATKLVLEKTYSKLKNQGLIIIDDYYFNIGCKKAVDDFIIEHNIKSKLHHSSLNPDLIYWYK